MEVYQPAEDSYLFAEFLKKYFNNNLVNNYLDMGCGSGILSEVALDCGVKEILATDINPLAVKSSNVSGIVSDLFEKVTGKFEVISFNAPYLPLDKREPMESRVATTGGLKGDEIAVRFLKEAKKHLKKGGKIFLLVSSLTPMVEIKKFGPRIVAEKRVFGEDLLVLEFV